MWILIMRKNSGFPFFLCVCVFVFLYWIWYDQKKKKKLNSLCHYYILFHICFERKNLVQLLSVCVGFGAAVVIQLWIFIIFKKNHNWFVIYKKNQLNIHKVNRNKKKNLNPKWNNTRTYTSTIYLINATSKHHDDDDDDDWPSSVVVVPRSKKKP